MNEKTIEIPPTRKIIWTEPVIQIIDIKSARHGSSSMISDAGTNHKS